VKREPRIICGLAFPLPRGEQRAVLCNIYRFAVAKYRETHGSDDTKANEKGARPGAQVTRKEFDDRVETILPERQ
jgi:hypothetical protein